MTHVMDVIVDKGGKVRPADPQARLPEGKAQLVWGNDSDVSSYLLSESALAEDWLRPEEEEAWAYLQKVK